MRRRHFLLGTALSLVFASTLKLAAQDQPVMLQLTLPDGKAISWTEATLSELPWHQIVTHTVYTKGPQTFKGPLLRDVLERGGITKEDLASRKLYLSALNDFSIMMPSGDPWNYDVLLAREMNGQVLRLRDKGPLWVVYPRDPHPELHNFVSDERWVWQLSEIAIQP